MANSVDLAVRKQLDKIVSSANRDAIKSFVKEKPVISTSLVLLSSAALADVAIGTDVAQSFSKTFNQMAGVAMAGASALLASGVQLKNEVSKVSGNLSRMAVWSGLCGMAIEGSNLLSGIHGKGKLLSVLPELNTQLLAVAPVTALTAGLVLVAHFTRGTELPDESKQNSAKEKNSDNDQDPDNGPNLDMK